MTNPNWGLLNGGGFQDALAQGLQFGQQITARREQREDRNALLEMRKAEFEDRRAEREATAAAKAEQAQQADMGTFRKLLKRAAQSPEGWAQAMGAAQSLGLDVRQVPQAYDPAWAQQQLFIMDAMEKDPEGMKGIAYELQMAGYKPGTPDFEAAARSVISNKYASEYYDPETGAVRRRSALNLGNPAPQIPDAAAAELRANPNTAAQFDEIFGQGAAARILGGPSQPATGGFPHRY